MRNRFGWVQILVMAIGVVPAREWSLQEALTKIIRSSDEAKIIADQNEKGAAQISEFVSYTMPSVNFNTSASFIYNSTQAQAAMFGVEDLSSIFGPSAQKVDRVGGMQYNWNLGVKQTLNVFRISTTRDLADTQKEILFTTTKNDKEQLMVKAINVYHKAWLAKHNYEQAEHFVELQVERVATASTEFEFGRMSPLDFKQLKAMLQMAKAEKKKEAALMLNAFRELNELLGQEENAEIEFPEKDGIEFLEEGLNSNTAENLNLELLSLSVDLMDGNAKYKKSFFFPSLELSLGMNNQFVGYDDNMFSTLDKYADPEFINYSAGVSLSWNLFNGFTTSAQYKQLSVDTRIKRRQLKMAKDEVKRVKETTFDMIAVTKEVYAASKILREVNEEAFERDQADFKAGLLRLADLNAVEKNYKESFRTEISARANYINALVQYRVTTGLSLQGAI